MNENASPSIEVAPARISATRALKNARHLQKVAPHLMPAVEPPEGFGSIIPIKVLAQLHKSGGQKSGLDPDLAKQLQDVVFPKVGNTSGDPLFQGKLYFVRIAFTVQNQGNAVLSVSAADVAVAIEYATASAPPISAYARQYGGNKLQVSQSILNYNVTLSSASYNDAQLQTWVNQVAVANGLGSDACVVVLNPQAMTNTSGNRAAGIGGYHGVANLPYIFVNLFGVNLTVADGAFAYAQILSHEMAEMVVDPLVDGKNPEVCDGCGPNCQSVFLDYFGNGRYIQSSQGWPPGFSYEFYINAIVKPASATSCPAPANACDYSPPLTFLLPQEVIAHRRDAAWLIELWLAIHGGDPVPDEVRLGQQEAGDLATIRAVIGLVRCLEDARIEQQVVAVLKPVIERVNARLGQELSHERH
jgi:hypothetical protein